MSEVSTDKTLFETTSPSGEEPAASGALRRAATLAAVVIAAHLPLFPVHLRNLWVLRLHYQFFPLLLAGIGWLLWEHWPRWSVAQPPRWRTTGLLACGLATLTVSTRFFSRWLAAVALVLSVGGLITRYTGPGQWRDWLPVWLVMWVAVPPPFRSIYWLQSSTLQMSSKLLDIVDIQHLMQGNVLVLPGHRMLVDEACKGLNSVLVLLVLTAFLVVASRRPRIWTVLLLASSVFWAWGANIVRVTTIAVSRAWFQVDLSGGWRHELLGYVTILLALMWLGSTNRCLSYLLEPIDLRKADRWSFAFQPSFLTDAWNWCLGEGWNRKSAKRSGGPAPALPPAAQAESTLDTHRRDGPRGYAWVAVFGLLAVLQLAGFAVPAADRDFQAVGFRQADMPAELAGWSLVKHDLEEWERSSRDGQFSSSWLLGIHDGGVSQTSYQVQVFDSSSVGLSAAERAKLRKLSVAARSQALTA